MLNAMKMKNLLTSVLVSFLCAYGLVFAQQAGNLTYGLVQQTVVKGASKEKIVESLGSPNMITSTSEKTETWIYDKISTTIENQSGASTASVGGGAVVGFAGVFGGVGKSEASNKATSSQKTMTVIIKFKGEYVESFSTRVTSF